MIVKVGKSFDMYVQFEAFLSIDSKAREEHKKRRFLSLIVLKSGGAIIG